MEQSKEMEENGQGQATWLEAWLWEVACGPNGTGLGRQGWKGGRGKDWQSPASLWCLCLYQRLLQVFCPSASTIRCLEGQVPWP